MAELPDWDPAAAGNNSAVPNGFPEAMLPGQLNDAAREVMAVMARYYQAAHRAVLTTGTAGAYALTVSQALSAYSNGLTFAFRAHATNTDSPTINVNGQGAANLQLNTGTGVPAGYIVANGVYTITYTNGAFTIDNSAPGEAIARLRAKPFHRFYPYSGSADQFSATWTKPEGLIQLVVKATAGGGGGEAGRAIDEDGGGGASSATVTAVFNAADLGATEDILVGRGGTRGRREFISLDNATNGFDTSFGSLVVVPGGDAAGDGTDFGALLGGVATLNSAITISPAAVSSFIIPSNGGRTGRLSDDVTNYGALGGLSAYGGMGYVQGITANTQSVPSTGFGSGGCGGLWRSIAGANGAPGVIELIEYF